MHTYVRVQPLAGLRRAHDDNGDDESGAEAALSAATAMVMVYTLFMTILRWSVGYRLLAPPETYDPHSPSEGATRENGDDENGRGGRAGRGGRGGLVEVELSANTPNDGDTNGNKEAGGIRSCEPSGLVARVCALVRVRTHERTHTPTHTRPYRLRCLPCP